MDAALQVIDAELETVLGMPAQPVAQQRRLDLNALAAPVEGAICRAVVAVVRRC
jgi:hypothetical protein